METYDETPTINAVWKNYTLYIHPYTHNVVVMTNEFPRKIMTVEKKRAEEMLAMDGLDIHANQLYTEILKLYQEQEERPRRNEAHDHLQLITPVKVDKYL